MKEKIVIPALVIILISTHRSLRAAGQSRSRESPGHFRRGALEASGITWFTTTRHARAIPAGDGRSRRAFFDYDNDGWMDIYLVNSGPSDFYAPPAPLKNALYRNNRDGTFADVTDKAGVAGGKFGMGVAAGDYDGDGWQDLFVTNYGNDILYHNNGDGTFTDVTRKRRDRRRWSTCAVWFDYEPTTAARPLRLKFRHSTNRNNACASARP